jgi:hypothetical protein
MERQWQPGQPAVIREVWAGRIFAARPCTVVADEPQQTVLFVPGHALCAVPVVADGTEPKLPVGTWDLRVTQRASYPILSFAWTATPYAVLMSWHEDGTFWQWYVNLQTPLVRTPLGFDTVDHALDVLIAPDRSSWSWKDEDELDQAVSLGLFTPGDAAWFRYWGERAVEHVLLHLPPFDLDWELWVPDPAWPPPELPAGWDVPPA